MPIRSQLTGNGAPWFHTKTFRQCEKYRSSGIDQAKSASRRRIFERETTINIIPAARSSAATADTFTAHKFLVEYDPIGHKCTSCIVGNCEGGTTHHQIDSFTVDRWRWHRFVESNRSSKSYKHEQYEFERQYDNVTQRRWRWRRISAIGSNKLQRCEFNRQNIRVAWDVMNSRLRGQKMALGVISKRIEFFLRFSHFFIWIFHLVVQKCILIFLCFVKIVYKLCGFITVK